MNRLMLPPGFEPGSPDYSSLLSLPRKSGMIGRATLRELSEVVLNYRFFYFKKSI